MSRPYTIATIGPLLKYFKENAKFPNSNDNVFARLVDEEAPLNPRL